LEKDLLNKCKTTKANAILCPNCCVEYAEVEFDLEVKDVLLRNVKALKCPMCKGEAFTPEQSEAVLKRVNDENQSH
jgi:hypothetical protein